MGNLLLVLRSQLLREGLRRMLSDGGFTVLGEVSTMEDALRSSEVYQQWDIGLIILEAALWRKNSDLLSQMRQLLPTARIAILATTEDLLYLGRESILSADGVLSLEVSAETMLQSLRLVLLGERMIPADLLPLLMGSPALRPRPPRSSGDMNTFDTTSGEQPPSPRELDVLRCLIQGASNKVIARELGITEATVKVHLKALLRKIRVSNRTQAAVWALNNGISMSASSELATTIRPRSPGEGQKCQA